MTPTGIAQSDQSRRIETSSDPSVSRNRAASSGLEQSPLSARRYHPSFCKVWETTSTHSHERGITRLCALLIDETTSTRSDDYLAVLLKVLAHGDGLLDEAVEVLREGRGEACMRLGVRNPLAVPLPKQLHNCENYGRMKFCAPPRRGIKEGGERASRLRSQKKYEK